MATEPGAGVPAAIGPTSCAVTPAGSAPPLSWNGADLPERLDADWGTRRYSTELIADVLAGSRTHPESWLGSTEMLPATWSVIVCAMLWVQGGRAVWGQTSGATAPSPQAATAMRDKTSTAAFRPVIAPSRCPPQPTGNTASAVGRASVSRLTLRY